MNNNKYYEYNLINNIPILFPFKKINFKYCPRYTIATSEKLFQCFENTFTNNVSIYNNNFKYLKINSHQTFKTMNNHIISLHYYIIVQQNFDFNINFKSYKDIIKWIDDTLQNQFVIVTTPILRYNNIYYSIANDNYLSVVIHNKDILNDDDTMINSLLYNNCYTLCDFNNIIISLFHLNHISYREFISIIESLKTKLFEKYTNPMWMKLIKLHKIYNACDFPLIFMLSQSYKLQNNLYQNLTNKILKEIISIKHTFNNNIFYTTFISTIYPNINKDIIEIEFSQKLSFKNSHVYEDYYGFFASILNSKSCYKYFIKNHNKFIKNIINNNDNDKRNIIFIDIFYSLIHIFENGYENLKLKKSHVRYIWKCFLIYCNDNIAQTLLDYFISIHYKFNVPYVFLIDIHNIKTISYSNVQNRLIRYNNEFVYKKINLYYFIDSNVHHMNNIYIYMKNNIKSEILMKVLSIYEIFGLFFHINNERNIIGELLLNYIRQDVFYII